MTEILTVVAPMMVIHRIQTLSNGDGLIKIRSLTQVGAIINHSQIAMPKVVWSLTEKAVGLLLILVTLQRPVLDNCFNDFNFRGTVSVGRYSEKSL